MSAAVDAIDAIDAMRNAGITNGIWPAWEQKAHTPSPAARRRWALWFAHRLWRGIDGYVCVARGSGGHFGPTGSYEFERFAHEFHRWPNDFECAVGGIINASETRDIYISPMLRASRSRLKGSGAASRYLWADCDGPWTTEREQRWVQMWSPGSFQVASGTGRHAYLDLEQITPPDEVVERNRRLAAHLDADAKWDDAVVLRLPGTYNHKGRARGGASDLVRVVTQ